MWTENVRRAKKIVATLQLEVAQRLMAKADDDDYGILTLLVQLDFHEPREWFKIPPRCFFPSPDIDSACVVLERRAEPLLPENLRAAYVKNRRKRAFFAAAQVMMMKLLKQDWPAEAAWRRRSQELKISAAGTGRRSWGWSQFVALT